MGNMKERRDEYGRRINAFGDDYCTSGGFANFSKESIRNREDPKQVKNTTIRASENVTSTKFKRSHVDSSFYF